jgi:ZIP family zinc transporter
MNEPQTLLLGLCAGATILIGLSFGRIQARKPGLRQCLNGFAIGILLFLVWDVLTTAFGPLEASLEAYRAGTGELVQALGFGALFVSGLSVGLMSLVLYQRWSFQSIRDKVAASGPGNVSRSALAAGLAGIAMWPPARRLAVLIAMGIGLHNFGEGLAIGISAATGTLTLATLLVIGFALHNATEGFGIVAPLAAADEAPSWAFLGTLGLIGGGPTFVGTLIGHQFDSALLVTGFLALAAGSILYVVIQLTSVASRAGRQELIYLGAWLGLVGGFVTDMVLSAAGA